MDRQHRFAALEREPLVNVTKGSGTFKSSFLAIREVLRRRELLGLLVRRDLKARYTDSALGFVWVLIRPLTQLGIYYFIVGKVLGASRGLDDFAIFIFAGLTAYGFFSEVVVLCTASIVGNGALIKKIYMPRELFPLAGVGSAGFTLLVQLSILLIASALIGSFPLSHDLVYVVAGIAVIAVFATGLGLLLAAANVYLRDIRHLVEVVLLVLLWFSPVVYSWNRVHDAVGAGPLLEAYTNNPITLAILGFQRGLWVAGDAQHYPTFLWLRLIVAFVVGLGFLFACHRVFVRWQGNFAQAL